MEFAEKLKKLRIDNEMSRENLAELLNVSRSAIAKWESAKGMPDLENIKRIASIFDVTIDSLIRDEEGNRNDGRRVLF
ncbi:helix-turn-helix transcriptional regulator [Anaerofustis stercorihominis]|uniref:XRE family transcriptional regulator n=1 Tax=Anaerofustis stercorihominis TaxID=214853 RepID=A0A3E3DX84_9FIRM|nr:helix-turn-helix transcriptional regulator [Anaerofustis stercorihominis]RGD73882.1 XRE family transcriptional regulator [Anaerofustis stercorihominis]